MLTSASGHGAGWVKIGKNAQFSQLPSCRQALLSTDTASCAQHRGSRHGKGQPLLSQDPLSASVRPQGVSLPSPTMGQAQRTGRSGGQGHRKSRVGMGTEVRPVGATERRGWEREQPSGHRLDMCLTWVQFPALHSPQSISRCSPAGQGWEVQETLGQNHIPGPR